MRILIATDTFPVVSQTFIALHCASLVARGHEVRVLAAPGAGAAKGSLASEAKLLPLARLRGSVVSRAMRAASLLTPDLRGATLTRVVVSDILRGRAARHGLSTFPLAKAIADAPTFDIVHAHFGATTAQLARIQQAGYFTAPLVATFHGTDLNQQQSIENSKLYERVFRSASHMTVGSQHMAAHFAACGVPSERYSVIPMGIDLGGLQPVSRSDTSTAPLRIVSVGRLVECKGTEYAIRAFAEVQRMFPEVTLTIVGDGPLRDGLENLAKSLHVETQVKFRGALPHDEVLKEMQEADIYFQPGVVAADGSREGQGLTIAEAQALQLPVVTTRAGGIPESVDEGKSAFVVEPKDVPALVHHLSLLIRDPALRKQMGEHGREFVAQKFDQQVLTDQWIALYERLIASESATTRAN